MTKTGTVTIIGGGDTATCCKKYDTEVSGAGLRRDCDGAATGLLCGCHGIAA